MRSFNQVRKKTHREVFFTTMSYLRAYVKITHAKLSRIYLNSILQNIQLNGDAFKYKKYNVLVVTKTSTVVYFCQRWRNNSENKATSCTRISVKCVLVLRRFSTDESVLYVAAWRAWTLCSRRASISTTSACTTQAATSS